MDEIQRIRTAAAYDGTLTDEDGNRIIPASRRPDGSLRKPVVVRAGFVPDEEKKKYVSPGRLAAGQKTRDTKAAASVFSSALNSAVASTSSSAPVSQPAPPRTTSLSSFSAERGTSMSLRGGNGPAIAPAPPMTVKSAAKNRPAVSSASTPASTPSSVSGGVKPSGVTKSKNVTSGGSGSALDDLSAMLSNASINNNGTNETESDADRQLRNLKKKLRQIREIQKRMETEGETSVTDEQRDKVSRVQEIEAQIAALESTSKNSPP